MSTGRRFMASAYSCEIMWNRKKCKGVRRVIVEGGSAILKHWPRVIGMSHSMQYMGSASD